MAGGGNQYKKGGNIKKRFIFCAEYLHIPKKSSKFAAAKVLQGVTKCKV